MIILVGFPQTTKEHIAGSPSEDSQHRTELTGFGRAFGHTQLTLGVVTVVMDGADQSEEALKEKAKRMSDMYSDSGERYMSPDTGYNGDSSTCGSVPTAIMNLDISGTDVGAEPAPGTSERHLWNNADFLLEQNGIDMDRYSVVAALSRIEGTPTPEQVYNQTMCRDDLATQTIGDCMQYIEEMHDRDIVGLSGPEIELTQNAEYIKQMVEPLT